MVDSEAAYVELFALYSAPFVPIIVVECHRKSSSELQRFPCLSYVQHQRGLRDRSQHKIVAHLSPAVHFKNPRHLTLLLNLTAELVGWYKISLQGLLRLYEKPLSKINAKNTT